MTTIFEMKWNARFIDSGWVAEIKGFETTRKFKSEFLIPEGGKIKASRKGLAIYKLEEGKVYMIENTGETEYHFAKVINNNLVKVTREDVCTHLIQIGHKPPANMIMGTNYTTKTTIDVSSSSVNHLCKEINYIINNLEAAFNILRVQKAQDIFKNIVAAVRQYAELNGYIKECLQVYSSLSKGESAMEIRMKL